MICTERTGEDNMKPTTEIARRCLFNMVSAMHDKFGCKGALDSDFSHCKSCVMFYAVNEWDGESTGVAYKTWKILLTGLMEVSINGNACVIY